MNVGPLHHPTKHVVIGPLNSIQFYSIQFNSIQFVYYTDE